MSKRILSLDYLRALAIIGDLIVHIVLLTSDLKPQVEADPFSVGPFYLIISILVIIFGHWRGFFLMISAIVHTFSLAEAIKQGHDRKSILKKQLGFGAFLFVWGLFREMFLNEWSSPREWLETGFYRPLQNWSKIYIPDALENIALSVIFTSLIFFFLTRKGGIEKTIRNCIILGIITVIVIFLPQPLYYLVNLTGESFPRYAGPSSFRGWWDYPLQLLFSQFLASESPLIPHMAYFLFGGIIGLIFTRKIKKNKLLLWGLISGFLLMVLGIVWLIFVQTPDLDHIEELIGFAIHPTWFIFLSLGMQLIGILLFMWMVEFNRRIRLDWYVRRTRHVRRWGVMALTSYCMLWIQYPIRKLFSLIFTSYNFIDVNQLPFGMMVLLLVTDASFIALILYAWQQIKYIGTMEWLMMWFVKRKKKKGRKGDALNIEGTLIHPEPVLWIHPIRPTNTTYHYQGPESKPILETSEEG